jgi:hypothetical protein
VLEALLLTALNAQATPFAEAKAPSPSLELLEFLGEFGDDDDLFDETGERKAPAPPATDQGGKKTLPKTPAPPASTKESP